MMKKIFLMTVLVSLFLVSCGKETPKSDKLQVYTSFYAMYDFARTIGGDDADVHLMCPSGSEPHEFEPKTSDIARLTEGDLFIYNGLGMEGWAEKVSKTLPDTVYVLCASENITAFGDDPHVWLDLTKAAKQMESVYKAFSKVEGDSQKYLKRLDEYLAQIDELEEEYENAGLRGKKLFVTHAAYGYLCEEIGMDQIALEGISGESDPSPSRMAEVIEKIKAEGAKCIFYDPLEGDKIANAVANEAGIEALPLYTFEGDTKDRDYVTVMRENLEQLKNIK